MCSRFFEEHYIVEVISWNKGELKRLSSMTSLGCFFTKRLLTDGFQQDHFVFKRQFAPDTCIDFHSLLLLGKI